MAVTRSTEVPRPKVWALGEFARVPNEATPERPDPPTCQQALRQARCLVWKIKGEPKAYRYRSIGQGATLGRDKGIADVGGVKLGGVPGSIFTHSYHLHQLPLISRKLDVLADGPLWAALGRDTSQLAVMEQAKTGPPARAPEEELEVVST